MRHYTSIEQSKKLLELGLSPNTADMCWCIAVKGYPQVVANQGYNEYGDFEIPCWSTGALMDILGKRALEFYSDGSASLSSFMGKWTVYMFNCPIVCSDRYDNPIDACFDVMVKVLNNDNLKKGK